jgi:hypothetical protein
VAGVNEGAYFLDGDISGRGVNMVHAGKDELEWASFCTDDEIYTCEVFFKFFFQLPVDKQEQTDEAYTEGEEDQAEQQRERFAEQVFPA